MDHQDGAFHVGSFSDLGNQNSRSAGQGSEDLISLPLSAKVFNLEDLWFKLKFGQAGECCISFIENLDR